jgi:hypothetical protein
LVVKPSKDDKICICMHGTNPKIGTFGNVLCGALVPRVGGILGEEWVWFVVGETFGETS